jgi:hypothetical protein
MKSFLYVYYVIKKIHTMKQFSKPQLKKEIVETFGSVSGLKKFLKENATYQYGGLFSEIEIYGCKISYNDNPNCFASFIITIPHLGFTSQYGLGLSSITKAGKLRLGSQISNHYITL